MLNDGKLIPTFSVCNRPLIPYYWTRIMVPSYSLLDHWLLSRINALMFIHALYSSVLWTVCKQQTTIYMLLVNCPPYSFVVHYMDELRNMESPSWADHFVCVSRVSSHHIYYGVISSSADCHVSRLHWSHVCSFLVFPTHWFCFIF